MQVQIARILDEVPEVSDYLSERIDEIPDEYRAQIGEGIVSLLEFLPISFIPLRLSTARIVDRWSS